MLLGNTPGCFSVGEVRFFWEYVVEPDIRCGCGELLQSCPFWHAVIETLSQYNLDWIRLAAIARKLDRSHKLPWLSTPLPYTRQDTQMLLDATEKLYLAIAQHANSQIIIDSSKVPSHLFLLNRLPALDVRTLHLVRDGRAVAYSWNKRRKRELANSGQEKWMARHSLLRSMLVWMAENSFVRRAGRQQSASAYTVLRYEDFAQNPYQELSAALRHLDLEAIHLQRLQDNQVAPQPTHSVGGNPIRFKRGSLEIVLDEEWQQQMPSTTRRLLGVVGAPMLHNFHYKVW